ncbi:MAG: DUF1080 domain-containing protein [Verrucomicrobia bacterium]|nr:DUF1080 domain-containing protein [Verrucomicrobiota bacterium]
MRHLLRLLAGFTLALSSQLHAADGWRELFNGRDLTGWKANAFPESWSVVDGTIRVNAAKESSHLFFVGDGQEDFVRFKNFELEVVARGEPNANSGIFIHTDRSTSNAKQHLAKGYEIQLNSTEKEKRKTGSLYAIVDLDKSAVDETKWFTTRITVQNRHIVIQINGTTTVDYTEPPDAAAQRPPERKGRVLNPAGGAIALQGHDPGSVFYFKSVRIRPLP